MMLADDFGNGDVFLSMLWFFLWIIWFWLLIIVFSDIFRSRDLSGWSKALWTVFVIVLPYLGVFIYLIVRGEKMHEHGVQQAQAQDAAARDYIQSVAGTSSPADEISRLAELKAQGLITEDEFQAGKAKVLSGG